MGLDVIPPIRNVTSDRVGLFTNSSPKNTFSITINNKSRPQIRNYLMLERRNEDFLPVGWVKKELNPPVQRM